MNTKLNINAIEEQSIPLSKLEEEVITPNNIEDSIKDLSVKDLTGVIEPTPEEFTFRPSASDKSIRDESAVITCIKGNSVVWNQLIDYSRIWILNTGLTELVNNSTITQSGADFDFVINSDFTAASRVWIQNPTPQNWIKGHKYIIISNLQGNVNDTLPLYYYAKAFSLVAPYSNEKYGSLIVVATSNETHPFALVNLRTDMFTAGTYLKGHVNIHDLTKMFGAGNEPTTIEEFYERIPSGVDLQAYNEGELIPVKTTGIKTVGFNQWDEEWEIGAIQLDTGKTIKVTNRIRSTNYNKALPNTEYYVRASDKILVFWYDADKEFIKYSYLRESMKVISPNNASFFKICLYDTYGTVYNHDICINLSHSGIRDGEYEPYKESYRSLPDIKKYFPDGLKSAGNVYDEITPENAIKRVGVVDLGSLNWVLANSEKYPGIFMLNLPIKKEGMNCKSTINLGTKSFDFIDYSTYADNTLYQNASNTYLYAKFTSYTDVTTFKASLQGIMLYYELAEPIITPIEEPVQMDYWVEDFGTEETISDTPSAPFKADIVYQFNAEGRIRDNGRNIEMLEKSINNLLPNINKGAEAYNKLISIPLEMVTNDSASGYFNYDGNYNNQLDYIYNNSIDVFIQFPTSVSGNNICTFDASNIVVNDNIISITALGRMPGINLTAELEFTKSQDIWTLNGSDWVMQMFAVLDEGKLDSNLLNIVTKDNGNIILGDKEFMPATPSGDPMHYMYEKAGAMWNSDTGYWELNGLTDLTSDEMRQIYNEAHLSSNEVLTSWWTTSNQRTNICFSNTHNPGSLSYAFRYANNMEVISFNREYAFSHISYAFQNCTNLKTILTELTHSTTSSPTYAETFTNCYNLEYIRLKKLRANIKFPNSPKLSYDSIKYLLKNRANAVDTPITLTLHEIVYSKIMGEEWADLRDLLPANDTQGAVNLVTELNEKTYGVEWDITNSSPLCTRIGNLEYHKTLPIQSKFRGCVANGKTINYYLDANDWSLKEDGTASVLDGTDGTVRVHTPKFYGKSGLDGDKRWVRISETKIDDTWTEVPEMLIDAYKCTLDRTNFKLLSIVNTSAQFRGGNNNADYDQYLETDPFRTQLGKPVTYISRKTARTYLPEDSELLCYEYYKWIFYWCYVIEYANFNSQAAYNSELTEEGYRQGGLGSGVTNWASVNWNNYNKCYPLTPCGYGNEFGNNTGIKSFTTVADTTSDGTEIKSVTSNMPRWRGFDNPFGDIWTNLDGVGHFTYSEDGVVVGYEMYKTTNLSAITDTVNDKALMEYVGRPSIQAGYVKTFDIGDTAEMCVETVGASDSTYKCDRYYLDASLPENRTLLVGGHATNSGGAGLGGLSAACSPSDVYANVGFLTLSKL